MNIFFRHTDITNDLYDDYVMIIPEKNILNENNIRILVNSFNEFAKNSKISLVYVKSPKHYLSFFSEDECDKINNFIIKNNIEQDEYYIIKGPILSTGLIGFMIGVQLFKNYNFYINDFNKFLRYKDNNITMLVVC